MMTDDFCVRYIVDGVEKCVNCSDDDVQLVVTKQNGRTTVKLTPKRNIEIKSYRKVVPFTPSKNDLYFCNGYQSWTDTKEFLPGEREKDVNRLPKFLVNAYSFDRYGDAMFFHYDKNILHGYDVFYKKGDEELFVLNENYAFAYLTVAVDKRRNTITLSSDLDLPVEAGREVTVADYFSCASVEEGMAYFNRRFPKTKTKKLFGYTSWYNYYQNVTEEILLRDLDGLDDAFDLFQIDDGYETKVGDWLSVDETKFPNGLQGVVDAAHKKGLKAGIWLAPFVAEEESQLFRTRKSLFKQFPNVDYVKCGSNWSGFYALDMQNAEAQEYVAQCLKHYSDMGFDFFKLDFLYAASLAPVAGKTRCEVAQEAYEFLRRCLADKLVLGCGATIFNSANNFDFLRIGPDVSLKFDDVWYMKYMHRERISTKVTLQNTVYRSFFDGRLFGNDPDVFLLREDNVELSKQQRQALLTINALFGSMLMTSDNVGAYDGEKRALLAEALDLFRNATVTNYRRVKDKIEIDYDLRGGAHKIVYDVNRGVLV